MRFIKRDANHAEIVATLRLFGFTVFDAAAVGQSFPDLVVGLDGVTDLVEIKRDEKAPLTPGQQKFANKWRGSAVVVLRSKQQAIDWATRTRHERRRRNEPRGLAPCVHRTEIPT